LNGLAYKKPHFLWLGRRNTGKRWATALVVKLLEIAWDLWDHRNPDQVQPGDGSKILLPLTQYFLFVLDKRSDFGLSSSEIGVFQTFTPLVSLASSLHYLDAWLLRVSTAESRQERPGHRSLQTHNSPPPEEHLPRYEWPHFVFCNNS
jgi:hypothetical protein